MFYVFQIFLYLISKVVLDLNRILLAPPSMETMAFCYSIFEGDLCINYVLLPLSAFLVAVLVSSSFLVKLFS